MPRLTLVTEIAAPVATVFDLARDIPLHCRTLASTGESAVTSAPDGKVALGDTVTFTGRHFGIRQRLTGRIVAFDPPHRFVDEMTEGAFASLRHEHEFAPIAGGTRMTDTIEYVAPFGRLGRFADWLFLERYMIRLIGVRNRELRRIAESTGDAPAK